MSSLALYRAKVPAHSSVPDANIVSELEDAALQHNAAAFGAVYAIAMVYFAAHNIQLDPASGLSTGAAGGGATVGALLGVKDGDVSRTYANTTSSSSAGARSGTDADLSSTIYGQKYLRLRGSRAATFPLMLEG